LEKTLNMETIQFIKSPLNYIGGKHKILSQIVPLFPEKVNCFIDLFAGGGNVGINVNAKKIILNDNINYLIDFYKTLKNKNEKNIIQHIKNRINEFNLSLKNDEGYKLLREAYNKNKDPLDLFVLVSYSFNHQIRFNNKHEFNNPFGRDRSCYNEAIENNLKDFINKVHSINIDFTSSDFTEFDFSNICSEDFVYCDPPYLITTGTYNDGKRGFTGWNEKTERLLLNLLDNLNSRGIKFALSNVLIHKGKKNEILINWIQKNNYYVSKIKRDYANSCYNTKNRDKSSSEEVVITNYIPKIKNIKSTTLFDFSMEAETTEKKCDLLEIKNSY